MQIWRIRFFWVFIPGIVFPIVALGGFEFFRNFTLPNIAAQTLQQMAVQPAPAQPQAAAPQPAAQPSAAQPPAQSQLSAAGNLVGNWSGTAQYIFHLNGDADYCYYFFLVNLTITNQTGNNINGNATLTQQKSEQHGNFSCDPQPAANVAINGTLSSSAININAGSQGNFSGSFTSRTITLNQPKDANGDGLNAPVNLLKQ